VDLLVDGHHESAARRSEDVGESAAEETSHTLLRHDLLAYTICMSELKVFELTLNEQRQYRNRQQRRRTEGDLKIRKQTNRLWLGNDAIASILVTDDDPSTHRVPWISDHR